MQNLPLEPLHAIGSNALHHIFMCPQELKCSGKILPFLVIIKENVVGISRNLFVQNVLVL